MSDNSETEDRSILARFANTAPIALVRKGIVKTVSFIPGEPDEVTDEELEKAKTQFEKFAGE